MTYRILYDVILKKCNVYIRHVLIISSQRKIMDNFAPAVFFLYICTYLYIVHMRKLENHRVSFFPYKCLHNTIFFLSVYFGKHTLVHITLIYTRAIQNVVPKKLCTIKYNLTNKKNTYARVTTFLIN